MSCRNNGGSGSGSGSRVDNEISPSLIKKQYHDPDSEEQFYRKWLLFLVKQVFQM